MKLANQLVSFSFDDRTGSLTQIRNLVTSRVHLGDPKGSRLFRIVVPRLPWASRFADSHDSKPTFDCEPAKAELIIRYDNLLADGKPTGISARIRVTLSADSSEAFFTLELHNHSPDVIEQVRFPWVGGWTGIAGPGQDRLTAACEIRNPHTMFPGPDVNVLVRCPYRHYDVYPAHLFLPWMDISGNGEGISYICYLERSVVAGMVYEHLRPYDGCGLCLGWSWVSDPFIKPGAKWISPRVGIGVHTGDWHATADRFRAWLATWHKPAPATKRLRESIGFQNLQFRSFDGTDFHRWEDLPRLAKESLAYGVEDLSLWDTLHELYIRDEAEEMLQGDRARRKALRAALTEVKRLGCNASMIFNFRLMRTTAKPFAEYGEELAVRRCNGSPAQEGYSTSHAHAAPNRGPDYHRGATYILCQTPPKFAERALNVIRDGLDLGLTSVFVDQANEWNCCLSEKHSHASPDDTPQGAMRWVKQARALVKQRDLEGYLIGEEPDVFSVQEIEMWWHWRWKCKHPEVFRYCIPESLQSWVVDADMSQINRAFVLGFHLCICFRGMEGSLADNPRVARHIARLAALRKRRADCTVNAQFLDNRGLTATNALAKVYHGEKSAAVMVGEIAGRRTTAVLSINAREFPIRFAPDRCRVSSTRHVRDRVVRAMPGGNRIMIHTKLMPFEVQIIELFLQ
ncbi:MAG: hypothetical protein HY360_22450 [Verrucomicrobia bacterium]|nr:hypothetical protein [Verrucomicrobiota bacterium]